MSVSTIKRPLFLLAVALPVLLAGCATREQAEKAQASADLADSHAMDARSRADAAHARGDAAYARADEAAGIGNNALGKSQSNEQRVAVLESDLKTAHAQIKWLSHNVVYKHPLHHKKHRVVHHTSGTSTSTNTPAPPKNPGM